MRDINAGGVLHLPSEALRRGCMQSAGIPSLVDADYSEVDSVDQQCVTLMACMCSCTTRQISR